jgi:hypothetical protein
LLSATRNHQKWLNKQRKVRLKPAVPHRQADLLAKSFPDSSNEIEDFDRFLKEIVASTS